MFLSFKVSMRSHDKRKKFRTNIPKYARDDCGMNNIFNCLGVFGNQRYAQIPTCGIIRQNNQRDCHGCTPV
jgi:hypothetical protein